MVPVLSLIETRVLGVLAEKERNGELKARLEKTSAELRARSDTP